MIQATRDAAVGRPTRHDICLKVWQSDAVMKRCGERGGNALSWQTLAFPSLRTKLLLFALLIVVFPGGVFGWIAISNGRRALTETIGRQLAEEARNGADSLAGSWATCARSPART